ALQALAARGRDAGGEHLLVERVTKRVLRAAAAVGPVRRLDLLHEAAGARQGGAVDLDVARVAVERRRERLTREARADHARGLQQRARRRWQAPEARGAPRARGLPPGVVEPLGLDGAAPHTVGAGQPVALLEVLDGVQ